MKQKIYKRKLLLMISLLTMMFLIACKNDSKDSKEKPTLLEPTSEISKTPTQAEPEPSASYQFTDALGQEVTVEHADRVVALYGSFAEVWLNAGGTLVGTTQDAIEERGISFEDSTAIIGTVKEPNLELILSLEPDLIFLSADIASQLELADTFRQAGITCACMRIDLFEDYLSFLRIACDLTGRDDLYEKNGLAVKEQIQDILDCIPKESPGTVLLLRAYSTGARAKANDNFTGCMLEEFGFTNIASLHPSLLEELSMEQILIDDPTFIFVTTMGAEEKALEALESSFMSDPAFSSLTAVKEEHFFILPKDLFHYKPNARWGESYNYLASLIYPDLFEP